VVLVRGNSRRNSNKTSVEREVREMGGGGWIESSVWGKGNKSLRLGLKVAKSKVCKGEQEDTNKRLQW
jgi:hypothetical protein